ncbi:MAG: DinB family protein [Chitinophagales bacterium]
MTKQYFITQAEYNIWANNIVHSWLEKISDEQWEQTIVSSFPSLSATALHTAGAETIWLDRLNKVAEPRWLPNMIKGGKRDVQDAWKNSSTGLKSFIENFEESKLEQSVSFKRPDGNTYELQHYQIFGHVFNHSTYHRGQIVTMLRQAGFTSVHSIDMSTYFWTSKKPVP